MPLLDVSDLCLDIDLADNFVVTRRTQNINIHGRLDPSTNTVYSGVVGVVCMASARDLQVLPEEQRMEKTISIVTKFRLQGPSKVGSSTYLPDIVTWHGSDYRIVWVDDYTQFGGGEVQALAQSVLFVDPPPPGSPP